MLSQKLKFIRADYRNLLFLRLQNDHSVIQINSLFQFSYAGKINCFRNDIPAEFAEYLVFIIQYTVILRLLIFYDKLLDPDIFLHRMVTVQVIFCDIQNRADLRSESVNSFQLKTADLRHCHGSFFHLQRFGGIGRSDISHYEHRIFRVAHDFPKKGRRSSLSVSSCDRQHSSLSGTVCKLHFSPDRKPLPVKTSDQRKVCGHSRTQDHKIQAFPHFFRQLARIDFHIFYV